MSHSREYKMEAFGKLLDVLDELREKCPWDRKQTNQSLRCNTIEEVYELSGALIDEDSLNIKRNWAMCCYTLYSILKSLTKSRNLI